MTFIAVPLFVTLAATTRRSKVARHIRGVRAAVPIDSTELVASRISGLIVTISTAITASGFVEALITDLALVTLPLIRTVAETSSSTISRNVVSLIRAVRSDGALQLDELRSRIRVVHSGS